MALISEKIHWEKLHKLNINIKTSYIVGNEIIEKDLNNPLDKDIEKGIICKKDYYLNNKLIHTEKFFDSRMEYSFVSLNKDEKYTCNNCGMEGKVKDFIDGCPYCKSNYNIDYSIKDLGSKYHYDIVIRKNTYRIITGIVDFLISLILAYFFIKYTSRTFNNVDIIKVFIYGLILSLILYYFFYIIDAYIVLLPIKVLKNRQNNRQINFWKETNIDKTKFFNNLNSQLNIKYYEENNLIDYDILDFDEFSHFEKNDKFFVKVKMYVRRTYLTNSKIISKYQQEEIILMKNNEHLLEEKDFYFIRCPNCGSSIDITKKECTYCGSEIKYLPEWILKKENS